MNELCERARVEQDLLLSQRPRPPLSERTLSLRAECARRAEVRRRQRYVGAIGSVVAAAAVATALVGPGRRHEGAPSALAYSVGPSNAVGDVGLWIAPSRGSTPLSFSDGSEVEVAAGSAVRVAQVTAHGATLVLEHGTVLTHVVPREGNTWSVVAGPYRILVTGTRFETTWAPSDGRLVVKMQEGKVDVVGACLDAPRTLSAGETSEIVCPDRRVVPSVESTIDEVARPVRTPPVTSAPAARAPTSAARGERGASADHHEDAATEPSAEEMMSAGDRARRAGDVAGAEALYRTVRRRFAGTEPASRATFLLARLLADAGRESEGEALFAAYVDEAPSGVFAQEAASRLLEAALTRADETTARERALRYLRDFPSGPSVDLARRTLER